VSEVNYGPTIFNTSALTKMINFGFSKTGSAVHFERTGQRILWEYFLKKCLNETLFLPFFCKNALLKFQEKFEKLTGVYHRKNQDKGKDTFAKYVVKKSTTHI